MARISTRIRIAVVPAVLAAIFVAALVKGGAGRLPVGKGTPMISIGEGHGLILASDGSLWSWGSENSLRLRGPENDSGRFMSLRRIDAATNWISVSAGNSHDLGIKSDGTIWTWGDPQVEQGLSKTPIPAAPGKDWKQAAAGGIVSLALKRDGTLWNWGDRSLDWRVISVRIGSSTNWVKVWASGANALGLQSDGSLWQWDLPEGLTGEPASSGGPGTAPARVSDDTNWQDVAVYSHNAMATKVDGTLWAWGEEAGFYTGVYSFTTPMRVVGTGSDWKNVCGGNGLWGRGLVKKDGSLWVMEKVDKKGSRSEGLRGWTRFRQVESRGDCVVYAGCEVWVLVGRVGISCAGPIGVILTKDGEVWTWGEVLGMPEPRVSRWKLIAARYARFLHLKFSIDPPPDFREKPWRLRVIEPEGPTKQ